MMRQNSQSIPIHRMLFRSALGLVSFFSWIIVFRLFSVSGMTLESALAGAVALYACSQAISFFLTPLAGAALRAGARTALMTGVVIAAFSMLTIASVFIANPSADAVFWALAAFAVTHGMYRAFYFLPYAAALGATRIPLVGEVVIAFLPAFGGYVLASPWGGASALFLLAVGIMLASLFPLARIKETYEPFEWSYGETLVELFARRNNLAVGVYILDGIQGAVLLLLWPLAVYVLLESFTILGAILTATLCSAFLGRFLIKKILRLFRAQTPSVIATIVFSSWVARLVAASPVQVLAVNVAALSGTSSARFSIDMYTHEQVADGGHFIDEYTAIKEMGLAVGRIAISILFIVLVLTTAESVAFVATILTAAIAGAWSVFLAHRLEKVAY